jgi:hypothetical protein
MRSALAGADCVVIITRTIVHLKLPVSLRRRIPLCKTRSAVWPPNNEWEEHDMECAERLILVDNSIERTSSQGLSSMPDYGHEECSRIFSYWNIYEFVRFMGEVRVTKIHLGEPIWWFPPWEFCTKQATASRSVDTKIVGSGKGGKAPP